MADVDALLAAIDAAPLSVLLQRALRIARRYSDTTFERWLLLELHGYVHTNPALQDSDVVPEYRTVVGQHSDDYGRELRLTDPKLGFVNETRLRFSVPELVELQRKGGIVVTHDATMVSLIRQHLSVDVSRFSFHTAQISTIDASIRVKLAEFLRSYERHEPSAVSNRGQEQEEIMELRPNIAGIGLNLRALGRLLRRWWHARQH